MLKGREGIWRLLYCKSHAVYEDIADEMNNDLIMSEQPELQGFFLTEVYLGKLNKLCVLFIIYL